MAHAFRLYAMRALTCMHACCTHGVACITAALQSGAAIILPDCDGTTGALSIVTAAIVGDLPDTEDGQVWGVAQQRQITPESSEEPMLPRHARTTDKLALTMKAQHK